MKNAKKNYMGLAALLFCMLFVSFCVVPIPVLANSQSVNVAIIGGPRVINGGTLPTTEAQYAGLGAFTFTTVAPADVSTPNLAAYDTVVLNVASSALRCNLNTNLTAPQKAALVAFVADGKKLIIYDSECSAQDYSWLPYPFSTNNPGAMGAHGTLSIIEENTLSSTDSTDPYYIDATALANSTDAIGDMNVMTTYNPNWCLDMTGTNINRVSGPVHTYAKYPAGTDRGLIIYNGMDVDYISSGGAGDWLKKIWLQELKQPFNPSGLPCGHTVVGINLEPATATNDPGTSHTVTATLEDVLGVRQPGIAVTFSVVSGPNAGAGGTCSANANCTTDANGQVSFTYTSNGSEGTDLIQACFMDTAGQQICSQQVEKIWLAPGAPTCDVNGDGAVNIDDLLIINAGRGGSDPLLDMDGDGVVTTNDARLCVFECDKPRCAR